MYLATGMDSALISVLDVFASGIIEKKHATLNFAQNFGRTEKILEEAKEIGEEAATYLMKIKEVAPDYESSDQEKRARNRSFKSIR